MRCTEKAIKISIFHIILSFFTECDLNSNNVVTLFDLCAIDFQAGSEVFLTRLFCHLEYLFCTNTNWAIIVPPCLFFRFVFEHKIHTFHVILQISILNDIKEEYDDVQEKYFTLFSKIKSMSVTGSVHRLIEDFLTSRRQFPVFNGCSCHESMMDKGVPQGSVLGSVLYLLYVESTTLQGNYREKHAYSLTT